MGGSGPGGGRRSEVFVKFQKKILGGGGGQGRCEWRSEVFVKISCCFFLFLGGGGCQVGGTEK